MSTTSYWKTPNPRWQMPQKLRKKIGGNSGRRLNSSKRALQDYTEIISKYWAEIGGEERRRKLGWVAVR